MSFQKNNVTLPILLSHYKLQGMIGVDRYIAKSDAILIHNIDKIQGKMCLELVDLINDGKLEIAEELIKKYVIELDVLTNRMYALILARNEEPNNLQIREMIEDTDKKIAIYRER